MKTLEKFWDQYKLLIANKCEDKNTRLIWDNLQEVYFIIKNFDDGSYLHTKQTELFKSS